MGCQVSVRRVVSGGGIAVKVEGGVSVSVRDLGRRCRAASIRSGASAIL